MAFAQREEDQPLPPKVGNQGTTKSAQQVNVLLNSYQMDIKQMVPQVFQYELRFVGERTIQKKDGQQETKVVDFASGPRNDVSKETRRRLIWQLYQQLLNQHADFFGQEKRNFTFDCALLLFSIKQLPLEANEQRKFSMALDRANLEDRCSDHIRRTETVTATISHTGVVNLRDAAAAYISGDRSVVQFLELLSSQRIYEQGDHLCFGNRMYEQDSVIQLQGDPRILKSGLQKNVRFVGDNVQNAQPILQIDPKKSAFQPAVELLNFLVNFLGLQNAEQYEQNPDRYYARANKQVRGLVLATTHLPEGQIQFSALKLTDRPAAEATFRQQGQQVRVIDYLQQKYALRIRYPGLPCAIHRKPGQQGQNEPNDSLYPIELLTILPGQRVPIDKQTPKLTEQMIRQCQVLPIQLGPQIDQQRDKAMVQSGNPFFKQHGLRVDPNQMRTEAQVLFPPAIQYNPPNDRVEPDRTGKLEWRTVGREVPQRRAYTACATWPTRWAVVIVQNSIPQNPCQQFCRELVNTAQKRGIGDADMPQRVDHFEDNTLEFVRDKFEFYRNYKCTFVLCFAPGKRDAKPGDIHQVLKYCEQQYNVLTLHVSPEIAQKGTSQGGGAAMVLENILMKLNLKLGGANFNLVTSTAYKQASRSQADVCADVWLSGKRMFIGIDFSHAPPLSMHDRQANKIPSIPSLVGMAYTVDKAMLRMRGTYWCQQTRQTTMVADHQRPFIEHIKEALSLYIATNDQFPEHLIVFRAGISEGEFQRISFWEGQAFCAAFEEVAKQYGGKFTSPAVTIVVCQRRSNYRMIPERITGQKAPEQNVMPGTVLDKRAMSAACTDFLLIPHKALQGTAQPTRCTVVHEWRPTSGPAARIPPQMAVEELENITNALCYSHGICAMSTALPGVLYAAGELAKRGRNNWKMHTEDGTRNTPHFDLPAQGQEGDAAMQAQMDLDRQRAQHNAEMTGELRPILPTKFWA